MQAEAAEAARRQAQKEAELRNGPAPDFDAEDDAETLKARAWDDWKVRLAHADMKQHHAWRVGLHYVPGVAPLQDDHPYGSGNSKRRPCG